MPTLAEFNRRGGNQTQDPSTAGFAGSLTALLAFLAQMEDRKLAREQSATALQMQQGQLELLTKTLGSQVRSSEARATVDESAARVQTETEPSQVEIAKGQAEVQGPGGPASRSSEAGATVDEVRAVEAQAQRQQQRLDVREQEAMTRLKVFSAEVETGKGQGESASYVESEAVRSMNTSRKMAEGTRAEKLAKKESMTRDGMAIVAEFDRHFSGLNKIFEARAEIVKAAGGESIQTPEQQIASLARTYDPVKGADDVSAAIATAVIMNRTNKGLPLSGPIDASASPTSLFIANDDGTFDEKLVKVAKRDIPGILKGSDKVFTEQSELEANLTSAFTAQGVDPDEAADFASNLVQSASGFGNEDKDMLKLLDRFQDEVTTRRLEGVPIDAVELGSIPEMDQLLQEGRFRSMVNKSDLDDLGKRRAIEDDLISGHLDLPGLPPAKMGPAGIGSGPFGGGGAAEPTLEVRRARATFDEAFPLDKFMGRGVVSATDDPAALGDSKLRELMSGMKEDSKKLGAMAGELEAAPSAPTEGATQQPLDDQTKTHLLDFLGGGQGDQGQQAEVESAVENARVEGQIEALIAVLQQQEGGQQQQQQQAPQQQQQQAMPGSLDQILMALQGGQQQATAFSPPPPAQTGANPQLLRALGL